MRILSHNTISQRDPRTWTITTKIPRYLYIARNEITGALMEVMVLREGFRIFSHGSAATYEVDSMLGCGCRSWEDAGGCCKHSAAVHAVERHMDREASDPAARQAKAKAEIAALGL